MSCDKEMVALWGVLGVFVLLMGGWCYGMYQDKQQTKIPFLIEGTINHISKDRHWSGSYTTIYIQSPSGEITAYLFEGEHDLEIGSYVKITASTTMGTALTMWGIS